MNGRIMEEYRIGQVEPQFWDFQDEAIRKLLYALSYNPRRVLELRYGLEDGRQHSLEETAKVFRRSINWVVEMESCALAQLYQLSQGQA